jgi:spoIIIJ-associated protein
MDNSEKQDDIIGTAREVLQKLLELMGISATVKLSDEFTIKEEDGTTSAVGLDIEGDDLGILIGRRGQTMASLQHVVRLIVSNKMQNRIPIVVDVEGYKLRRYEGLRLMAERMADQVRVRKAPFTMEPMPAFERRVIHMALADSEFVTTESTGVGEDRKVVIIPRKIMNY